MFSITADVVSKKATNLAIIKEQNNMLRKINEARLWIGEYAYKNANLLIEIKQILFGEDGKTGGLVSAWNKTYCLSPNGKFVILV